MAQSSFTIKESSIAGNGVFTVTPFAKNETVCFLEGEEIGLHEVIQRVNEGKEGCADPLQVDDERYIDLNDFSRTINHSCDPNTFIRGKNELIALREILPGEEITYDYSTTMHDCEEKILQGGLTLWTCVCTCGAANCRKIINQFNTLPADLQLRYLYHKRVPHFIFKKFNYLLA